MILSATQLLHWITPISALHEPLELIAAIRKPARNVARSHCSTAKLSHDRPGAKDGSAIKKPGPRFRGPGPLLLTWLWVINS